MLLRSQHLMISRTIGGLAFSVALIMTPRAWVEEEAPQEIRIEALNQETCKEESRESRMWLNPDEVHKSVDCTSQDAKRPAS